jgi:hypothetical protein
VVNDAAKHRLETWRMIPRRACELRMKVNIGYHTFGPTGSPPISKPAARSRK